MKSRIFEKVGDYLLSPVESFQKLENLVEKSNISFYALGKELNFASSFFSEWKRGKMMPKADKLMALSKYFKVPMEHFMEDTQDT